MSPATRHRIGRHLLAVVLALLALLATSVALAQRSKKAEAQDLKRVGDEAMLDLRYPEALEAYDKAYDLDPQPALRYNRGRALQALSRFPEALDELEAFDRDAPASLKARVPKLNPLIAEVRAKVSTVSIKCDVPGASVLIRDRRVGTTPLAGPIRVNAGGATIELSKEGYRVYQKQVDLPGGDTIDVEVILVARRDAGVLVVKSPQAGALVYVDGRKVGAVPAEADVSSGKHTVRLAAEGFDDSETAVVVKAGDRKTIEVQLKQSTPIHEKWWLWTGVGAVAATGVILTVVFLTERPADEGDIPPGQVPVGTAAAPLFRF